MKKILLYTLLFTAVCLPTSGQDKYNLVNEINNSLVSNQTTVSKVLTDTQYMKLHSLTVFREVIKQNAKAEKIDIAAKTEPGTRITVKGTIVNYEGKPLGGRVIYVYQTSSVGWYSDTAPHILKNEGDRLHARLFGYFKTNEKGGFEFETIKPHGYPNSSLPAHIHIEIPILNHDFVSELLFDDDDRLVGEIRANAIKENFLISKNEGTAEKPVYLYRIVAK